MIRRPPRSTPLYSSAASDVYKRQVFTHEEDDAVPELEGQTYPDTLTITGDGVQKLLTKLKPNKTSGSDAIPARILKELAVELAPALSTFFTQSLCTLALYRLIGPMHTYHQVSRSIINIYPKIIARCHYLLQGNGTHCQAHCQPCRQIQHPDPVSTWVSSGPIMKDSAHHEAT